MEDSTHHQRTYRHDSYIMFLVMVDVELNGPSERMLEAHIPHASFYFIPVAFFLGILFSESGPFSFHIQPLSLQPPSVTNHIPILYLTF